MRNNLPICRLVFDTGMLRRDYSLSLLVVSVGSSRLKILSLTFSTLDVCDATCAMDVLETRGSEMSHYEGTKSTYVLVYS